MTGWSADQLPPFSIPARVLRVDGAILRVITAEGPRTIRNRSGAAIAVGDWLALDAGYPHIIRGTLPARDDRYEVALDAELERVRAEVERLRGELDLVQGLVHSLVAQLGAEPVDAR
ncbi:hypothetical protein OH146_11225 [Salinibacterium sp. SYSU T00001]|uniref:hypothetical protein n=1 Tax=Homoserinimonas sedimenticola TaxID=2986805 RepID=UPI002235F708|nr:hypothetical protein [Salinibacterium sedimenticola]MCW4386344.1 hypothetical protein [Salinibacterium sedimenticola]